MGTLDGRKLLGLRGTLFLVSVIFFFLLYFVSVISTHRHMCVCVWKMRDKETLDGSKLLWLRGTLLLVSVIGFCLVVLCLRNFDEQTDVRMEIARQGNTGQKKIALAEGNPPLCLCDLTLSCFTLSL